MRDVRVALAQISPRLGDLEANLELHVSAAAEARAAGAELVVFPELSLTGYLLRDIVPEVALTPEDPRLAPLVRASNEIDLLVGLVEDGEGHRFYNTALHFSQGRLLHRHRKLYLPTYGMFQEGRDFAAGDRLRRYDARFGSCGVLICEDHWHFSCAWLLAHAGTEIVFTVSNGPTRGARPAGGISSIGVWEQLLTVSAQFHTAWMVYVNRVGCEDGLIFGGGSLVVDPFGRVTARLDPLDEGLLAVDLDAETLRRARTAYPLLRDERLDLVQRELGRLLDVRHELDSRSETP